VLSTAALRNRDLSGTVFLPRNELEICLQHFRWEYAADIMSLRALANASFALLKQQALNPQNEAESHFSEEQHLIQRVRYILTMAKAQVERWAMDHPTCPRTGHYFEVPLSQTMPRVFAVIAGAGVLWWGAREFLWSKRPDTLKPEFIEEVKKIGNVAVRSRYSCSVPKSTFSFTIIPFFLFHSNE
jgi:hypothetical protein